MRVVIADDEKYVRLALKDTLQHLTLPIEIVGEAADGREAYELCMACRPDILITDICMPEEDGFVLLEKIRKALPELPVIIYSGYDDFSYAQKAIHYRIAEYLLKPIDEEKLEKAIKNIQSHYNSSLYERTRVIRNEILDSIIKCKPNRTYLDWMTDDLEDDERDFLRNVKGYSMELLCLPGHGAMEKRKWEAFFGEYSVYSWCLDENTGFLLVICDRKAQSSILSAATRIWKTEIFLHDSRLLWDKKMEEEKRFDEIRHHWMEMNHLMQLYFWDEPESDETESTELSDNCTKEQYNQKYHVQMNAAIKLGKRKYLKELLAEYWKGLLLFYKKSDPVLLKSTMRNFLGREILHLNLSFEACEQISRCLNKTLRVLKADQVLSFMMECADQIYEFYQKENAGNHADNMKEVIKEYLEVHYKHDITLEQLAEYLHFNTNYTSSLFKKIFGKTFVLYLTDMRMEKAKSLLESGEFRIYEVARQVGYDDERYFQKTFKKITGMTPKEYQKRENISKKTETKL